MTVRAGAALVAVWFLSVERGLGAALQLAEFPFPHGIAILTNPMEVFILMIQT
jgi:hypothetical protein